MAARLSQAVAATAFAYGAHGLSALLFAQDAFGPATRIIAVYIGGLGDGTNGGATRGGMEAQMEARREEGMEARREG